MNERVRARVLGFLETYDEVEGGQWVFPESVNAHVETNQGSDIWRVERQEFSAGALDYGLRRLLEEFDARCGPSLDADLQMLVINSVGAYQADPTVDSLVLLACRLEALAAGFRP